MKKIFSLMLAAVLALGLTAMAWAVAEEPGASGGTTYTDDDRITIEKCYRLVNDGTVSPAETFHFSLTTLGVTDSTETLATMPRFTDANGDLITGFDISFAEGEATAILKVQQDMADSLKLLNEAAPNDQVIKLKALEALEKVADGKATKLIIPSEIQGLAGLAASAKTILSDDKPEA